MKEPGQNAEIRSAKLAAAAESLKRSSGVSGAAFCLAFLTDRTRAPEPEIIIGALPPGAAVILRDYGAPNRAALAQRLKALCATRGVLFLVGGDLSLAHRIGADGLHFPSWTNIHPAPGMLTVAACHSALELEKAAAAGAQLAFLSPAFATQSHPGGQTLGAALFKSIACASPLPVLALGGVNPANAGSLAGRNVTGLAAISAFLPDYSGVSTSVQTPRTFPDGSRK